MPPVFFVLSEHLSRLRRFDLLTDGTWNMSQSTTHVGGEFRFLDNICESTAKEWFTNPDNAILVPYDRSMIRQLEQKQKTTDH